MALLPTGDWPKEEVTNAYCEKTKTALMGRLLDSIATGTAPWQKQFATPKAGLANFVTGKEFTGWVNRLTLLLTGETLVATARQIEAAGGKVKPELRRSGIPLWVPQMGDGWKTVTDPVTGEERRERYSYLRGWSIYYALPMSACEKLPQRMGLRPEDMNMSEEARALPAPKLEEVFAGAKLAPVFAGDVEERLEHRAPHYTPATGRVTMPLFAQWAEKALAGATDAVVARNRAAAAYTATLFHELVHLADDRLGRITKHSYADGELLAEVGSLILCLEAGVDLHAANIEANSFSYIAHWAERAGGDVSAKLSAAFDAAEDCIRYLRWPDKVTEKASK